MKIAFLSGLALTSLLLGSCAAGDSETDGGNNEVTAAIDPAAAKTGPLAEMQGSWVSTEDPKNTIKIQGSSFQRLADGKLQDDASIIFVDACKTQVPDFEGKAFVLRGKEKPVCYLLSAVSEEKLSYIHSLRGRTFRFTREK